MKRFVLLFFALLGYSLHATGQEQRIAGFIYATDPTEAIPFASLWLYDPATGEPEYGTLTSANGYYEFDAIATNRTYRLEISGPGIQPQTRQIEIAYVPGIEGRRYFHFPVIRSQKDLATVHPVEVFLPEQIAPDARTIEDFYSHIPGITYEDGYLTDENGATVCLMFSGIIPDEAGYAAILTNLTADNIERIEYYRLDNLEEPYYDGVLNFVTVGVNFNAPSIKEQLTPSPGCEL